jgi:hypothetical protein
VQHTILGIFVLADVQGPVLVGGVKACEGGASWIAGSGVDVTSLRMQSMRTEGTMVAMDGEAGGERTEDLVWTDGSE